jgi:cobalt-zinc-cadmium efflux system outer membrane protein
MLRILILLFLICFIEENVKAQKGIQADTLLLSLQDAETAFLKNNFDLLAAKYQIAEADAVVIQAKLWDNPNLNIEQGAYNSNTNKWFDISQSGETAIILQQLIYLAGKRDKRINIEKINSQIAGYQFYDLMRALRYELRTSFFEFYFLRKSLSVYDREIAALKLLVDAYSIEYKKGNIPFKELARLQALQFNLENEKIDVLKNLTERQSNIILLTGDTLSRPIKPIFNISAFDSINAASYNLGQLYDYGLSNRYDLKISEAQILSGQVNLSLQKAMRIRCKI